MRIFNKGDRVEVVSYSKANGYTEGQGFFRVGDKGTVTKGTHSTDSVLVKFDNAHYMDGEWYVVSGDLSLLSSAVITPDEAADMLRDDIKMFPTDKLEVANALARIFTKHNPEFNLREFLAAADL